MEHKSSASVITHPLSRRSITILVIDLVLLLILLSVLPFDHEANIGLALMVFISVLWLTEAIHVTITALLIPVLAVGFGLLDVDTGFKSFANPTIFLFFGGFALATALHIQGLDRLIANRLLLLARGRLSVAVIFLFLVTAAISMWINNTSTTAMMLPLALGILSSIDQQKARKTYLFLLLGVAYSANIGGMGTLVGSTPNAITAAQLGLSFFSWMKMGIPMVLVMMPLMIGIMYFVLRPNLNYHIDIQIEKIQWTRARLITLGIFVLTVISWIFSTQISVALGNVKQFDSLVAIAAAVLIGMTGVASWNQIQSQTDWGVLLLFGGGLTLSVILQESGASVIIADRIAQAFDANHWFIIILTVAIFVVLLTEVTSNTASAALLVPLFITIGRGFGMPEVLLPMIISFGASCAFMLPVATPPNAIVYGTGYIKQSEMVRIGILLNIVSVVIITLFAWFFWY